MYCVYIYAVNNAIYIYIYMYVYIYTYIHTHICMYDRFALRLNL